MHSPSVPAYEGPQEDRPQRRRHTPNVTWANEEWETRNAELWAAIDDHERDEFVALIDTLAAKLPPGSAIGLFERAGARDSMGYPDRAVRLYQAALDGGLTGERRRRAVIQMASSIRNLGEPQTAVDLLTAELAAGSDALDGAVRAVLALALVDVGREREAVAVAVTALAEYLPRYNRSMRRYAQMLTMETPPH
jgi:tetratricopeptide (TPR) repeat protein